MTTSEVNGLFSLTPVSSFPLETGEPRETSVAGGRDLSRHVPISRQKSSTCLGLPSRVDPGRIIRNLLAMDAETGVLSRFLPVPKIHEVTDAAGQMVEAGRTYIEEVQARIRKVNFHLPPSIRSNVPANVLLANTETLKNFLLLVYDFDLSVALADEVPGTRSLEGVGTAEGVRDVLTKNAACIHSYVEDPELEERDSLVLNPSIHSLYQCPLPPWRTMKAPLFCLPAEVCKLKIHRLLADGGNEMQVLPQEIEFLTEATHLSLEGNQLKELPRNIQSLVHLRNLDVSSNGLTSLPEELGLLKELELLSLTGNKLTSLPCSIVNLENLRVLNISDNVLGTLPQDFSLLRNLQNLSMNGNRFSEFPREVFGLPSLLVLRINQERLSIPKEIGSQIPSLQRIVVRKDLPVPEVPDNFEIGAADPMGLVLQRKRVC